MFANIVNNTFFRKNLRERVYKEHHRHKHQPARDNAFIHKQVIKFIRSLCRNPFRQRMDHKIQEHVR